MMKNNNTLTHNKCILCNKDATISHHINYKQNLTIPVCYYCHRKIHKDRNNKYYPIDRPFMKSIGLSDEVYEQLLWVKHEYEKKDNRVISYDEIIFKLIQNLNGEIKDGKNKEVKR